MKIIILKHGEKAVVDDEWYEMLSQKKWYFTKRRDTPYVVSSGPTILMHRLIMNAPKHLDVDHINGNTLDNRKCNLRLCTRQENSRNRGKSKGTFTSKYKGVSLSRRSKGTIWSAQICHQRKCKYLGCFTSEHDAARAYNDAAKQYHGEFASLNRIEGE